MTDEDFFNVVRVYADDLYDEGWDAYVTYEGIEVSKAPTALAFPTVDQFTAWADRVLYAVQVPNLQDGGPDRG